MVITRDTARRALLLVYVLILASCANASVQDPGDATEDVFSDVDVDSAVDPDVDPDTDPGWWDTLDAEFDTWPDLDADPEWDTWVDPDVDPDLEDEDTGFDPGDVEIPVGEGTTCVDAIDLTYLATWSGSYSTFGNLWGGDTTCADASGPEVWFTATVPAGDVFTISETTSTNVTIHRLAGCLTFSCMSSATSPETLSYYNDTGLDVTLFFALEAYSPSEAGPVAVAVTSGLPPQGYSCADPVVLSYPVAMWSGFFSHYADLWTGGTGCGAASGREVWFSASVPAGNVFTMEETSPTDVTIQRVDACGTTDCVDSAASPERHFYYNDTGTDVTLLYLVEARASTETGPVSVEASSGPPPVGFTCDSPVNASSASTTWIGSFYEHANMWSGTTGCGWAAGPEVWFTATVPAGNVFTIEETTSTNVTIQQVDSCGLTTCSASRSSPESYSYFNGTGSDVTFLFAVEAYFSSEAGPFIVEASNTVPPGGYSCPDAINVSSYSFPFTRSFSDFGNLWTGGPGCGWAAGPEVWLTATVPAGNVFTMVETTYTNVTIQQVTACGSTTCGSHASAPEEVFYHNTTGADVTFIFAMEAYFSSESGSFTIETTNESPPEGYDCANAIDVSSPVAPWSGLFSDYDNLWAGGSGCGWASGPEVWFTAIVPVGNVFTLEETTSTNVTIQHVTSCGATSCQAHKSYPESYSYYNASIGDVTLLVAVDAYFTSESGPLTVETSNGPPGAGDLCSAAIDVTSLTTWTGDFGDHIDHWYGDSTCGSISGPEVWFTATVPNGNTFSLSETSGTDVVIEQVSACSVTSCLGFWDSPEDFTHTNTSGIDEVLLLIVELKSGMSGTITLDISSTP